jgi:hypothetical protein
MWAHKEIGDTAAGGNEAALAKELVLDCSLTRFRREPCGVLVFSKRFDVVKWKRRLKAGRRN